MLSRTIWRTLLESRSQLPPTFLLPWTANLSTVSHSTDAPSEPPPTTQGSNSHAPTQRLQSRPKDGKKFSASNGKKPSNVPLGKLQQSLERNLEGGQASPKLPSPTDKQSPLILSRSVRDLLPVLQAQSPHYITAHIHGFPYLLTEGDTVRLPFLMHGVEPGDVIRLNRAINLGSRDLTLKAPAPGDKIKSPVTSSRHVIDPTTGSLTTHSNIMPEGAMAPHFIPHIAKGKHSYIDDRLFVCRAVVMGVESEPLRIKEKTKRRQRHVRKVKSKHRYTILKIKELRVKSVDEIGGNRIEE
ncbi:Homocitrate dehydratase, mitochondrial [Pseudocercospora fuligena]|uniref:Large ribosomal subunit protein bL21m n=1 Tax=Pseudocercospora fuligena TaxID=685502 RepID=A0A8H6RHX0_9PEZI|nr:Homocitrate dehydratase, mitochondrial [Pseudocercospora fuligena]